MTKSPTTAQRRLAAILSADVSGYARLMNADQTSALRMLDSHRESTDRLIAQYDGRIANTAGDSILAEFPSAASAIHCALAIQEKAATLNEQMPLDRRMHFRIGIHVGEVLARNGDIFGDDVNIAARLQGLAVPGTLCLSGAARGFARDSIALPFEDLGSQEIKNIPVPVRAYLLRPAGEPAAQAIPRVHRRMDANLIRRCYQTLHDAMAKITAAEELEPVEVALLASLGDAPGSDHRLLAERVGMDSDRALKLAKHLASLGLVEGVTEKVAQRTASQRPTPLRLTSAGRQLCERIVPAMLTAQDRIMAPLSEAERETLRDLLARVVYANDARAGPSSSGKKG
jgi:adenylate cyclase